MTLLRKAIALPCGAALFVIASPVFAQSVMIAGTDSLPRTDANGAAVEKRPSYFTPEGINLADCISDERLVLPVTLDAPPPDARLEVWAGPVSTDCTPPTSRSGAAATCTRLQSNLPLVNASLSVPMRAIAAAGQALGTAADASVCGLADQSTVAVFVMMLTGSDVVATAMVDVPVDTVPNPAPQDVVDEVEGTVHVTVTPPANLTSTQLAVYCAEAGGAGGTCNGSAISYAGSSPDADFDARYRCVTIAREMAPYDAYVKTLPDGNLFTAGTNVVVRVSSVDAFGNIGPLSAPQCAVEEEVADVGDPAKCSTTPGRRAPMGSTAALVAAIAVVVTRRRSCLTRRGR